MLRGMFSCFRNLGAANDDPPVCEASGSQSVSLLKEQSPGGTVEAPPSGLNAIDVSSGSQNAAEPPAAASASPRRQDASQPQVVLPVAAEIHECSPFELMDGLQLNHLLGQGTFGRVYQGAWTGTTVAIKIIVTPALNPVALKETHLGPQLQHPHVVQTYTTRCARLTDEFFDVIEAHVETRARQQSSDLAPLPESGAGDGGEGGAGGGGGPLTAARRGPGDGGCLQSGRHLRSVEESGDGFGDPEAAMRGDPTSDLYGVLYHMQAAVGYWVTLAIMEHCDMRTLHTAIERGLFTTGHGWSARVAWRAAVRSGTEVARGLLHLHGCGVVHGDVKPSNILLRSSRADRRGFTAKVSDFGAAHVLPAAARSCATTSWGTVAYMAPEHLRAGRVSRASDVHSFGVVLWEMLTQRVPYANMEQAEVAAGLISGSLTLAWPTCPAPMDQLVALGCRCTAVDPASRPELGEVIRELVRIEGLLRDGRRGEGNGPSGIGSGRGAAGGGVGAGGAVVIGAVIGRRSGMVPRGAAGVSGVGRRPITAAVAATPAAIRGFP